MALPTLLPGQILIGSNNKKQPTAAHLKEGSGVKIDSSAGSITISSKSSSNNRFDWSIVCSQIASLEANKGYILEWNGEVTLSLPSDAQIGDEIKILSKSSPWKIEIKQNQEIILGNITVKSPKKIWTESEKNFASLVCIALPAIYMVLGFTGKIKENAQNKVKI